VKRLVFGLSLEEFSLRGKSGLHGMIVLGNAQLGESLRESAAESRHPSSEG